MRERITYTLPCTHDTIHLPFKAAYQRSGYGSYAELAEACGVPQSNLGKFFAGSLKTVDVANLARLAVTLNACPDVPTLSLDALLGIAAPAEPEPGDLREKLAAAEARAAALEDLRAERRSASRTLAAVLLAVLELLAYVIVDASAPGWGIWRR